MALNSFTFPHVFAFIFLLLSPLGGALAQGRFDLQGWSRAQGAATQYTAWTKRSPDILRKSNRRCRTDCEFDVTRSAAAGLRVANGSVRLGVSLCAEIPDVPPIGLKISTTGHRLARRADVLRRSLPDSE